MAWLMLWLSSCTPSLEADRQALHAADSLYMAMDIDRAVATYQVVSDRSPSVFLRLEADRGLMRIYRLTAMSEEYYECRSRATERMERINEEPDKDNIQTVDIVWEEEMIPPTVVQYKLQIEAAARLNREGRHREAIDSLSVVIDGLNAYHAAHYGTDSLPPMALCGPRTETASELIWYDHRRPAPMQLIADLREQLCMAYSGIEPAMREWSDYNRNAYLDILDVTRQDREWDVRVATLEHESTRLNLALTILAACLLATAVMVLLISRWSHRRISRQSEAIRQRLTDGLSIIHSREEAEDPLSIIHYPLSTSSDRFLELCNDLSRRSRQLADEARERLDEARDEARLVAVKREDDKRENVVRRACFAVVAALLPIVDRLSLRLRSGHHHDKNDALLSAYVATIGEYNDILTRWIELRRGAISLKIETFDLSELFALIEKGTQAFRLKGITLTVCPTRLCVKADKALTLFMINTLADNARKFTPAGGTVTVEAQGGPDVGYVEVAVSDTGIGLSDDEQARVMGRMTEGSGFGLMNCRGIVEQYRKSGPVFDVCRIGVESRPGKGSRFYFRLPVGVRRALALLCAVVCLAACHTDRRPAQDSLSTIHYPLSISDDSLLLDSASLYADAAYYSNLDGRYEYAICFIDSALMCLNEHRRLHCAADSTAQRLLRLRADTVAQGATPYDRTPESTEEQWWNEGFDTDYHILLDIRNEAAVASLALKQWDDYTYNNDIYTRLYRLLTTDQSIVGYHNALKRTTSNKRVGIGLDICLIVALLYVFYLFFVRKRLTTRWQLEQTLETCERIVRSALNGDEVADGPVAEDLCADDEGRQWIARYREAVREAIVDRPAAIDAQADDLRDEAARTRYEDNALHVQNRVLDNCLSTIKHETVYYPNKIRQLTERLATDTGMTDAERAEGWQSVAELLGYYRGMIAMLGSCAARQSEQVTFRHSRVRAVDLLTYAAEYFARANRTKGLTLTTEPTTAGDVLCDEVLLRFLVENLINAAIAHDEPGTLRLTCADDGPYVCFALTDRRTTPSEEALNELFYPTLRRMTPSATTPTQAIAPPGTEYLICKQVIREHDEHGGRRGCRINARPADDGQGFTIRFTVNRK